jgi:oligopeptide/dipeptide ABC transporter ATP-binding protein
MEAILSIRNLAKHYPIYGGILRKKVDEVKALDGVDLDILRGECLGLVGESGCGKTTLGKCLVRMHRPTNGSMHYLGVDTTKSIDIAQLTHFQLKQIGIRSKLQMVFQDPTTSLDPRMLIKHIMAEPIKVKQRLSTIKRHHKVCRLLERVGLNKDHLMRYPHEFSGGQRQRIAVARAIAAQPDFIVLDEPTSALDVSVQAQILNLLQNLRKELQLTYLFITHHLLVVRHVATRIAVMYLGRMVELAPTERIFQNSCHPYTRALLSAIPRPELTPKKERMVLKGDVPSPRTPPSGCRFHTRCPFSLPICHNLTPTFELIEPGHFSACHRSHEVGNLAA